MEADGMSDNTSKIDCQSSKIDWTKVCKYYCDTYAILTYRCQVVEALGSDDWYYRDCWKPYGKLKIWNMGSTWSLPRTGDSYTTECYIKEHRDDKH